MGVRWDTGPVLYFSWLICLSAIILRGIPHASLSTHCDGLKTSSLYPSLVVLVFCSIKGRLDAPVTGKLSLLFNRMTPWLPLAFPFHITQTTGAVETELYLRSKCVTLSPSITTYIPCLGNYWRHLRHTRSLCPWRWHWASQTPACKHKWREITSTQVSGGQFQLDHIL